MRGQARGLTSLRVEAMVRSRAAVRSRLRHGLSGVDEEGVSPRKQVGDAESMLRMVGRGNSKDYEDEL